ncbi:hypothetical protein MFLAVUS_007064 [Mucor flavus]|uniref:Uncharacterized protein n=1 Tax=Mucor flavus TaxID=439312 RepID=A0ABP9Z395_9FUNG
MSSSPRFWQKLGLGKQSKNSSTSTSNSGADRKEGLSMQSSISFNNVREATLADSTEKQAKRFSNMSLRHRASSASLNQQMTSNSPPDKLLRRGSYMKPLRRIDPEESNYLKLNDSYNTSNIHDRVTSSRISPDLYQQRKLQKPTRKPSIADMSQSVNRSSTEQKQTSKLRQPSPAIAHAKLLSRSESSSSVNSTMTVSKKKKNNNIPKLSHSSSGDDDTKSLTRSSSNGSTVERNKRKSSIEKRKSKQDPVPVAPGQDFMIDMLKDELEKEKASSRSLQGQKEAISKDLDYFCNLVDEVTEEKDTFKQKYEQEKLQNEELKQSLEKLKGVSSKGAPTASQLKIELETVQQRATEEQYVYYNNLQFKTDENNKLRHDLKQAQRQIQVLRKTMEQMLRADGKDFDDNFIVDEELSQKSAAMFDGGEKYLLLQTGYHPDQQSPVSPHLARPTTNPPSPTPCYSAFSHDDDEDLLSTTSKESYQSGPLRQHYDFLKYDIKDDEASHAKRKSAEYSKKIAMSRRRKDQLEEMLGEVDSQLNKVKQKMRPS